MKEVGDAKPPSRRTDQELELEKEGDPSLKKNHKCGGSPGRNAELGGFAKKIAGYRDAFSVRTETTPKSTFCYEVIWTWSLNEEV